jgi:hypothetical protein
MARSSIVAALTKGEVKVRVKVEFAVEYRRVKDGCTVAAHVRISTQLPWISQVTFWHFTAVDHETRNPITAPGDSAFLHFGHSTSKNEAELKVTILLLAILLCAPTNYFHNSSLPLTRMGQKVVVRAAIRARVYGDDVAIAPCERNTYRYYSTGI